jgi:hypothetical protein
MASSLKELVETMMGPRDSVVPSTLAFPAIDEEDLARRHNLERRAADLGVQNQPPSTATTPDLAEMEIRADIERRALEGLEDYLSQIDIYEGRIRRAVITTDQRVRLEAAGQNAPADFRVAVLDDRNHLHQFRQQVLGYELEYEEFRKRNGLQRLPRIPTSQQRTVAYLLITLFILAESILNGMFFAEGSETGLIGGITQALVLSLLNIGGAFLYGSALLPLLYHKRTTVKMLGLGATIAYGLWAVVLNLAIGHFRDIYMTNRGNVSMAALLTRISESPAALSDAKSGLLVLFGVALALLAVLDAALMRDRYPGFAEVGARRRAAIKAFADETSRCFAELQRLRDKTVDDMSSAIAQISASQFDLQLAVQHRSRLHSKFRDFLEHLSSVQDRLVQRYREGNRRHRTAPIPAYFESSVERPARAVLPPLAAIPELEADHRHEVIDRIERYIKEVNEEFARALPEYQTVEHLTTTGVDTRAPA